MPPKEGKEHVEEIYDFGSDEASSDSYGDEQIYSGLGEPPAMRQNNQEEEEGQDVNNDVQKQKTSSSWKFQTSRS